MSGDFNSSELKAIEIVAETLRARDPRRAAALADAAMAGGLRHPILFSARALWLSEQGRHGEALADFKRADAMSSPNAATKNAIALCLAKLGRYAEAIEEYAAAITLQPASAQLHYRMGWVHEMAGDLGPARLAHERAISLQPDYADALARLAFLAARLGEWRAARSFAARALELDSRQTAAELAFAMCELEDNSYDAAERRLDRIMNGEHAGSTDRYLALGLLGDLRDKQDRVGDAFAFYQRANDLVRQDHKVPAGEITMHEATSALCRYLEGLPRRAKLDDRYHGAERAHVFLLGFLRSGTTLLEQVLASDSDVVALEEKDTLAQAVQVYMARPEDLDRLWAAGEAELDAQRAAYWERVKGFGVEPAGKVVVDKMPINTVKIPIIWRLFPEATILFAIRDPRDVVLSCFRRSFGSNASTSEFMTLESTARFYDAVMQLAELCRAKLPLKLYELRLEDLVNDFDGRLRALCKFVGLPWSEEFREFSERAKTNAIPTPSATQVIRGLNSQGVGQWRRYRDQMAPVLPVLKPWVQRFGYPED